MLNKEAAHDEERGAALYVRSSRTEKRGMLFCSKCFGNLNKESFVPCNAGHFC